MCKTITRDKYEQMISVLVLNTSIDRSHSMTFVDEFLSINDMVVEPAPNRVQGGE